jgi:hypothetical protein
MLLLTGVLLLLNLHVLGSMLLKPTELACYVHAGEQFLDSLISYQVKLSIHSVLHHLFVGIGTLLVVGGLFLSRLEFTFTVS